MNTDERVETEEKKIGTADLQEHHRRAPVLIRVGLRLCLS
jgi:hypothetical protein